MSARIFQSRNSSWSRFARSVSAIALAFFLSSTPIAAVLGWQGTLTSAESLTEEGVTFAQPINVVPPKKDAAKCEEVLYLSYSPYASVLAAASESGSVKLWDAATSRSLLTLSGHTDGRIRSGEGLWRRRIRMDWCASGIPPGVISRTCFPPKLLQITVACGGPASFDNFAATLFASDKEQHVTLARALPRPTVFVLVTVMTDYIKPVTGVIRV